MAESTRRGRGDSTLSRDSSPNGPADVAAGYAASHWRAPRGYGAQAHAEGHIGARDAGRDGSGGSPDRGGDPFAPARFRYDMQAPAPGLRDSEQLVGGRSFSGLAGEIAARSRGPKGYQRSDERIREDICEALISATHLDASEVTVDVENGKVTLRGIVPERRMKHTIEDITAECRGVTDVDNHIRVVRGGAEPLLDAS